MINGYSRVAQITGGGLEFVQSNEVNNPGTVDQRETKTRDTGVPHPDLKEKFEDLKTFFLRSLGLDPFPALFALDKSETPGATIKERQAVKDIAKVLVKLQSEIQEKIEIRSVSISGTEEKPKIIISGVVETPNGKKAALNTPLIDTSRSTYGFEESLLERVEQLVEEVEKYRGGKRQQLSMDFGDDSDIQDEGQAPDFFGKEGERTGDPEPGEQADGSDLPPAKEKNSPVRPRKKVAEKVDKEKEVA